jgi:SsrA-binding protein
MDNKKARFNYELLDSYTAGIQLTGPEVKAIREGKVSFNDSYCMIENGEVFLKKLHISVKDGDEKAVLRDRKLLLNKSEIKKLEKGIKEKGLTIVPTAVFVNKTGLIKANIALAKGKKNYDKRESIKKKDLARAND